MFNSKCIFSKTPANAFMNIKERLMSHQEILCNRWVVKLLSSFSFSNVEFVGIKIPISIHFITNMEHKFPEEDSGGILSHYLLYTMQTLFKIYFIIACEFPHCLWND